MRRLILALVTAFCLSARADMTSLEPGAFTFSADGGMYRLEANKAPVNDVLKEISTTLGIPVCLDPGELTTITANTRQKSLEKLLDSLSQSHAIVYAKDAATGQFRIERIVSTRKQAACAIEEGELERTRVMQVIMNAARGVRNYSMSLHSTGLMGGQQGDVAGSVVTLGEKLRVSLDIATTNGTTEMSLYSDGKKFTTYAPEQEFASVIDIEQVRNEMGEEFARRLTSKNYDPFEGLEEDSIQYMGLQSVDGQPMYVLSGKVKGAEELRKQLSTDEGRGRLAKTVADSVPMPDDTSDADREAKTAEIEHAMQTVDLGKHIPATTTIWISPTDSLPRKSVAYNEAGQEMTTTEMSDVRLNPVVDESVFSFTLPTNVTVIDQTRMIIEMQKMEKPAAP